MEYVYFIILIAAGGAAGGLTFSMTTDEFHRLRMPKLPGREKSDKDIETGCVGHMIIGSFAGILLVSLAITQVDGNLVTASQSEGPGTVAIGYNLAFLKILLYTFSVSLVGGFLGLRLIVRVSDAAVKQLGSRLNQIGDEVGSKLSQFDNRIRLSSVADQIKLARALMVEGHVSDAQETIDRNLRDHPSKEGEFVKGLILKRRGLFREAIEALDRADKLPRLNGKNDKSAAIWFNKACYLALMNPADLESVITALDESIKITPSIRSDIASEPDFSDVVQNPRFRSHFMLDAVEADAQKKEDEEKPKVR
jgi:tetratricopeptide (TPR) repeat protein